MADDQRAVEVPQGKSSRRRWLSTGLFAAGLVLILVVATVAGRLDRPPSMPRTAEHEITEKMPNPKCMECHAPESLPKAHPTEYQKFSCFRCHQLAKLKTP